MNLILNHVAYVFFISTLVVGKALRRAAEGKASAQAEAAEWRRKYELERARNLQLEPKGVIMLNKSNMHLYILVLALDICSHGKIIDLGFF